MISRPKVLAFAGSTRRDSWNKKLLAVAVAETERAGAEVTVLDLRDLALPLYDGDLEAEEGLPAGALRLKELMKSHDGFLIASPEYNSSISAVLKNAIDWASRPAPNERPLEAFDR
jgi:chromate reductase, NAD(P)H dehydrogenase (quinone)